MACFGCSLCGSWNEDELAFLDEEIGTIRNESNEVFISSSYPSIIHGSLVLNIVCPLFFDCVECADQWLFMTLYVHMAAFSSRVLI